MRRRNRRPRAPSKRTMLGTLKDFFDRKLAPRGDADDESRLRVCAAALLVEVMRVDGASERERDAVLSAVRAQFALGDEEASALIALAEQEARESVGHYEFTSLINRGFDARDKERIVELMWQVAYADATLSAHEQHVIRKIAELLYVPHGSYIAAKLRARDRAR